MRRKVVFTCLAITIIFFIFIKYLNTKETEVEEIIVNEKYIVNLRKSEEHDAKVEEFYKQRKNIDMSELGRILFLNSELPSKSQKIFKILIWKDGPFLERRHLRYFQNFRHEPFERCSVNNCELTYEDTAVENADAVVFLLHRLLGKDQLPKNVTRSNTQRWIFLTDESPFNTFLNRNKNNWTDYNGIFNWSMSYKMESDIPVPYGRTLPIAEGEIVLDNNTNTALTELIPNFPQKQLDVLAAVMISNYRSTNFRMPYIKELQKHIKVDVYGRCGTNLAKSCPGHFGNDCPKLNEYMFYLAFENSDCNQYLTEKLYWNSYEKGAIPIIMGTSPNICKMHLPPNSFIHIKDFANPIDLARYLIYISDISNGRYFEYHKWRKDFLVINEHGYFGNPSVHYCRICEALNYNSLEPKVYDDLSFFLNIDGNCIQKNTFLE